MLEGFALGIAFDTVILTIDRRTGDVNKASAQVVPTCNAGVQPDPETAALVAQGWKRRSRRPQPMAALP
jgi:hypothetical protein